MRTVFRILKELQTTNMMQELLQLQWKVCAHLETRPVRSEVCFLWVKFQIQYRLVAHGFIYKMLQDCLTSRMYWTSTGWLEENQTVKPCQTCRTFPYFCGLFFVHLLRNICSSVAWKPGHQRGWGKKRKETISSLKWWCSMVFLQAMQHVSQGKQFESFHRMWEGQRKMESCTFEHRIPQVARLFLLPYVNKTYHKTRIHGTDLVILINCNSEQTIYGL